MPSSQQDRRGLHRRRQVCRSAARLGAEPLESRRLLAVDGLPTAAPALLHLDGGGVTTSTVLRGANGAAPRLLGPLAVIPPGAAFGTQPCIGDFSGDGLDDLAWRAADGRVWVSVAGTEPGWSKPQRWGKLPPGTAWGSVRSGDFDADGRGDLAGRDPVSQLWTVSRGAGGAFTTTVFGGLAAAAPWQSFVAIDLDGDGRTDLAARNAATGNWRMLPSTGTSFGRSVVIGATPGGGAAISVRPLRLAAERPAVGFGSATPVRLADLSPASPLIFVDPAPAGGYSSAPREFTRSGDRLFFVAEPQRLSTTTPFDGGTPIVIGSSLGRELWWSDGTEAGTRLVLDIQPRAYRQDTWTPPAATSRVQTRTLVVVPPDPWVTAGSQPADVTVFNGRVVFTAFDETHGRQVWSSDGTAAGTWRISDVAPMPAWWRQATHLAVVGRRLYYSLDSLPTSQWPAWPVVSPAFPLVRALWRTDGAPHTAALVHGAAVTVADISWQGLEGQRYVSTSTGVLAALGSSLIFSGSDAGLNNEPWILTPADATR